MSLTSRLPNEMMLQIFQEFTPNELRQYRTINKSWYHVATPLAFRILRLPMTLDGSVRLHSFLHTARLRDFLEELVLAVEDQRNLCRRKCPLQHRR
jgi:hypothetical protein